MSATERSQTIVELMLSLAELSTAQLRPYYVAKSKSGWAAWLGLDEEGDGFKAWWSEVMQRARENARAARLAREYELVDRDGRNYPALATMQFRTGRGNQLWMK